MACGGVRWRAVASCQNLSEFIFEVRMSVINSSHGVRAAGATREAAPHPRRPRAGKGAQMADETDALSAAERLKFKPLVSNFIHPPIPLKAIRFANAEEWTFDKLAAASALYQAAKDEEAEEKLGRVLKAVAAKIVQQVREAVKTGGTVSAAS